MPSFSVSKLAHDPIVPGETSQRVVELRELLRSKGFAVPAGAPPESYGDSPSPRGLRSAVIVATLWADQRYWGDRAQFANGLVDDITWRAIASKRVVSERIFSNLIGTARQLARKPYSRYPTLKVVDYRNGKNGAPTHPWRDWDKRGVAGLKPVGHHTGGPASFMADASFHVNSNYLTAGGAPALAYHLTIDLDGEVGVWNNPEDYTWHARGGNASGVGISVRGNLNNGPMTRAQKIALKELIRQLDAGTFKVNGRTWGPKLPANGGRVHLDYGGTSCPGTYGVPVYRMLFA